MLKVLIIEDDVIDQLALTRLIKKNGLNCKVTVAMKIHEAVKLMDTHSFDLVICDLNLPDGKAFDLKELIRKQPFILLSGHIDPDIIKEATHFGAIKILQKSSDLMQLTSISSLIKSMLDQQPEENAAPVCKSQPVCSKFNIGLLMKTFDQKINEVSEIIELFLLGNPKLISDIFSAIRSEDKASAKMMLHRLKSNCRMIGLKEQQLIAERIEYLTEQEKTTVLESEMEGLKFSLESVLPELKAALAELKSLDLPKNQ